MLKCCAIIKESNTLGYYCLPKHVCLQIAKINFAIGENMRLCLYILRTSFSGFFKKGLIFSLVSYCLFHPKLIYILEI